MKKIIIILTILIFPFRVLAASEIAVLDLDSGRFLYESNSEEKRLIASITKIMTAIIVIENMNLNDEVTVGDEVLKAYGTNIYIEVGETLKVKDLLYGLILRSGNDAALTLSYNIKDKDFIKLMNDKAKEIGMNNTTFENPHGLDEETKNYSTAHDMALLSRYAFKNKTYRNISKTKKYTTKSNKKSYIWYNRNKLLTKYQYCTGGKNGYTPSAGKTLVTTATKDDLNLTIVTLNDPNIYETHESLYDYYFNKYKKYKIIDKEKFYFDKSLVNKNLYIKKSFDYPLTDDEIGKVKTKIHIKKTNSNKVGKINIYLENNEIGSIDVYSEKAKKKEPKFFNITN